MQTIAAFLWDVKDKTIKYFILKDKNFREPTSEIIKCSNKNRQQIKSAIKNFFDQLLAESKNNDDISIEYKTYFDSPQTYRRNPNEISMLVDKEFQNALEQYNLKEKSHKAKSLLKGKSIKAFKHFLENKIYSHKIKAGDRKLWEIAFHARVKTLESAIKKIYKFISGKSSLRTKENKEEFNNLWWNKYFKNQIIA